MFGRLVSLAAGLLLSSSALGCDSLYNTTPIPLALGGGGAGGAGAGGAGSGGQLAGAAGSAGGGGTPWVSPVASEISQQWTWQECGRLAPRPYGLSHELGRPIYSLAISADGSLLASNAFRTIGWRVADSFADSQPIWEVGGEGAMNVALSADGRLGSISGDVRMVFDAQTGVDLYWEGASDIPPGRGLCFGSEFNFSPDGSLVAGKHYTSVVDVIETTGFTRVGRFQTSGCGQGIAFDAAGEIIRTPDGMGVVAGLDDSPSHSNAPSMPSWKFETLRLAPDGCYLTTTCTEDGCSSFGTGWGANFGHADVSAEGHWYLLGGMLFHAPSSATIYFDEQANASLFAPNGDVIVGERDGELVRFCRVD